MDLKAILNDSDGDESQTPPPAQTPPVDMKNLPPEFLKMFQDLQAQVAKTQSMLDDALLANKKRDLISQYRLFVDKQGPDFDEKAFFTLFNKKYDEYIAAGATPEQAQATVDAVYMTPAGWTALAAELKATSAPKNPDEITQRVGETKQIVKPTKANLGAIMSETMKKD